MTFSADYLISLIAAYIWPFTRLASMLMTMLVLSSQSVPSTIRLYYAMMLTVIIAPILPAMPAINLFSANGMLVTAQQVLIGVAVGYVSQMLIQAFVIAGQIISMQTSLGFASMVDPLNGESTPVVGQLYLMLSTLVFFAIDGHLMMIQMISQSFITLPVGVDGISLLSIQAITHFIADIFAAAIAFSLSATIALLLINFTFGVMTRAAPQLNVFSMGFAVTMLSGLFILWVTIGGFVAHFENHWQRTQILMCQVLQLPCAE